MGVPVSALSNESRTQRTRMSSLRLQDKNTHGPRGIRGSLRLNHLRRMNRLQRLTIGRGNQLDLREPDQVLGLRLCLESVWLRRLICVPHLTAPTATAWVAHFDDALVKPCVAPMT